MLGASVARKAEMYTDICSDVMMWLSRFVEKQTSSKKVCKWKQLHPALAPSSCLWKRGYRIPKLVPA